MNQLRRFLKANGKSQGWLARELGVSRAYVSMLLSGDRMPSLVMAFRIESLTGVPARAFAKVA